MAPLEARPLRPRSPSAPRRQHDPRAGLGVAERVVVPEREAEEHVGGDPEALATLRSMTGEGRLIDPEEIAGIFGLVGDHPALNGAVIHANLGQRER